RQGGFRRARRPEAISLLEIVSLFEEPDFLSYCLLGTGSCPADRPCLAHQRWLAAVEAISRFLDGTTLADIATTPDGSPVGPLTVQWPESASRTAVGFEG
ncbi:MAG: RrF2 family transcriptional regulator, partial [Thermomicrobium sp.]